MQWMIRCDGMPKPHVREVFLGTDALDPRAVRLVTVGHVIKSDPSGELRFRDWSVASDTQLNRDYCNEMCARSDDRAL